MLCTQAKSDVRPDMKAFDTSFYRICWSGYYIHDMSHPAGVCGGDKEGFDIINTQWWFCNRNVSLKHRESFIQINPCLVSSLMFLFVRDMS